MGEGQNRASHPPGHVPWRRELIQVENSAHSPTQGKQHWLVTLAVFGGASLGKNKGITRRTEARPQGNACHGTPGPAPKEASYPLRVETDLKPSLKAPTGNLLGSLNASHMTSFQFFKGPFLLLEVTSDLPWFPGAAPSGNCPVCSCYRDIMGYSPGEEEKLSEGLRSGFFHLSSGSWEPTPNPPYSPVLIITCLGRGVGR